LRVSGRGSKCQDVGSALLGLLGSRV